MLYTVVNHAFKKNVVLSFCYITALDISFTSAPDGYGLKDQEVTFTCQYSPAIGLHHTVIEWYHNGELFNTTTRGESYTIASFQSNHSGNYSCAVFVMVGEVIIAGVRSVEKTVKLAGNFLYTISN